MRNQRSRKFPYLLEVLFRVRYRKSGDFVLGDVMEEYTTGTQSVWWVWRQLCSAYSPERPGERRRSHMFLSVSKDAQFAARTLKRNPGFAAIAILTIALGVGINSAIFSVLNAAALRPLPVPNAHSLVSIYQTFRGKVTRGVHGESSMFSTAEYGLYRDTNHVFSGLIAYSPSLTATLGGDMPRNVDGQYTSCNYFDVLNEQPALGHGFTASDCAAAGTGDVVVLSNDLWRSRFAADPAILGKTVVLNRLPFTVVGVAQPKFRGTEIVFAEFWVPLTMQPRLEAKDSRVFADDNMSWLAMIGKTKDGESLEHVKADLSLIAARTDQQHPGRTTTLAVDTANFAAMPEARSLVLGVGAAILVAVAMLQLIICANLANLVLARGLSRQKEIAIRLSVGATRARLVRQLMTENLVLALAGGILGCATSFVSFGLLLKFVIGHLPKGVPGFDLNVAPDLRVLGYSLITTILTAILFGLIPTLRATKINAGMAVERKNGILRSGLVGIQVAMSMLLLIVAGLMLRGLYAAQTVNPGFEMKDTVAISFELRNHGFDEKSAIQFQHELRQSISALPGVDAIAQARVIPLSVQRMSTDMSPVGGGDDFQTEDNRVSPEYFSLLAIPIVRGRTFEPHETNAVIVTESTARRIWPGQDPLKMKLRDTWDKEYDVVGVAKDGQVSILGRSNESYIYFPVSDKDQMELQWLVHSRVDQQAALRKAMHDLDPNLVFEVTPLEDNLEWWRTPSRIVAVLAASLGGIALLLATMGIYGVASFAVSRRVKEIGIRIALGADRIAVRNIILRQGLRPVLIGAVLGTGGCTLVAKILRNLMFGLSPYDPIAFIGVPMILIAIAWLATLVPAERASKVDPMVVLRYE